MLKSGPIPGSINRLEKCTYGYLMKFNKDEFEALNLGIDSSLQGPSSVAKLLINLSEFIRGCQDGQGSGAVACSSIKILEDQLDELIVEASTKRKQWPRKILVHAVQAMKAEQEMLKLYQPFVAPEEIRSQPSQDAYIADLKQVMDMASKEISGAMKSLSALIERAEGFSHALTRQPTLELSRLRQVFAECKAKEENNVQNFIAPGEVTPTDTGTSKIPCVLLKRKQAADSPERRLYPLRRRKIVLSA
ncbi:hypothetical protein llap_758 [Limosa lapponica baueri]|uniref:Uncharacterized protein n=1 Tax=Limosa lapponica baueri TaxID=1758121 RepID=A0A2I0US84_LIMLA|nr:hypothetical protein llap_758 [Limosa lapponica baueri]